MSPRLPVQLVTVAAVFGASVGIGLGLIAVGITRRLSGAS